MAESPATQYLFEDFLLDPVRKLLLRAGEAVPITHKAFQLLLLLVENAGRLVTKEEVMTTVWADTIVEDSNLTQTISVLRKTLGENPNHHRFIVTEPGKGYRFVAAVTRVSGDVAEPEAERVFQTPTEIEPDRGSRYVFISLAVLMFFSVLGFAYYWNQPVDRSVEPTSAAPIRSIAVLPFKPIDSSDDDKLLGIGMADAVITKLSHIKSVVVRQTNTVIRYADSTPEAIRVARDLNVDAVLEGSIQKDGGRIRVSARLYRVSDGALIWAEMFDERDTDIFTLQDSISEKVAISLSVELNPYERDKLKHRYTDNLEAYQLYNKGRFFWNNRSSEDLRKSIDLYEQAIAKDKSYALAYAALAESYVLLHLFSQDQDGEAFSKARDAAEKALALDENVAEAHNALAMVMAQHEWDWEGADAAFRRAVEINPGSATVHQTYGEFLGFVGRTTESIREVEIALKLDPLSLSTNTAQAFPYLVSRQYDIAIEKLNSPLEMEKNFPLALFYLARCYDGKGRHKEAITQYRLAIQNSGGSTFFSSALINSLVKDGQRKEAEKMLADLTRLAETRPVSLYVFARAYAALGDKEKALAKLEEGYRKRASLMHVIRADPNFDEIRNEPRLQEIVRKMKLDY